MIFTTQERNNALTLLPVNRPPACRSAKLPCSNDHCPSHGQPTASRDNRYVGIPKPSWQPAPRGADPWTCLPARHFSLATPFASNCSMRFELGNRAPDCQNHRVFPPGKHTRDCCSNAARASNTTEPLYGPLGRVQRASESGSGLSPSARLLPDHAAGRGGAEHVRQNRETVRSPLAGNSRQSKWAGIYSPCTGRHHWAVALPQQVPNCGRPRAQPATP